MDIRVKPAKMPRETGEGARASSAGYPRGEHVARVEMEGAMGGSIRELGAITLSIVLSTVMLPSTGLSRAKMTEPETTAPALGGRAERQRTAAGNPALAVGKEAALVAIEPADTSELGGGSSGDEYSIDEGSGDDMLARRPAPANLCYESPTRGLRSSVSMITEAEFRAEGGKSVNDGCTPSPSRTCTDMYEGCREMGRRCNRQVEGGMTLCRHCHRHCVAKRSYKFGQCYSCGFE
jgi:hypothetical protein